MRLFTGIELPEDVQERVERLLAGLRPAAQLKWSPVYNLHITTKFIGEWPEQRLPELTAALRGVAKRPAIGIHVDGIGWMPNPHRPHVLFTAVHSPELPGLAKDIDALLTPLGIEAEKRAYHPHLTLARVKDAVPLANIRKAIAELASTDAGSFEARHFNLYLSQTGAAGSVYTKLEQFPFAE